MPPPVTTEGRNAGHSPPPADRRRSLRRNEDRQRVQAYHEQARQLQALLELGRLIALDLGLNTLLFQIAEKAAETMRADRCSVFLHDPQNEELWVTTATEMDGRSIRIPVRSGIAGACFASGKVINLEDAYRDPRFNPEPDSRTGYRTSSLLCLPLFNREQKTIGVIQLLNKKEGLFTAEDEDLMQTYANHAAVFLEMAQLQRARIEALEETRDELRRLNQAKGKALHHLSHELRTPLSVIQGHLRLLRRKGTATRPDPVRGEPFGILEKNLNRLFDIQQEAEQILRSQQRLEDRHLLEDLGIRLERLRRREELPAALFHQWQDIRAWVEGRTAKTTPRHPATDLVSLAGEILEQIRGRASGRGLHFDLEGPAEVTLPVEGGVVREALVSLMKNAVENTPDGGRIRIQIRQQDDRVTVGVEDTGVGIRPEDQPYLFDGLFHTQDTELYTSKKPFEFNAGGKGLDLWRTKLSGECYGFRVTVRSRRCPHLSGMGDLCPGAVTRCPHCLKPEDCARNGGSLFLLELGGPGPDSD